MNGMSSADIDAMLLKYGFFPGDTREPAAEAATPPSLAKPASGGEHRRRGEYIAPGTRGVLLLAHLAGPL